MYGKSIEEIKEWLKSYEQQEHEESLRFRAWVPGINKMIYQEDFFQEKDGGMLGIQFDKDGVRAEYYTNNEIITDVVLMKYTGIKAVGSKDLYDGDVVIVDDVMFGDIHARVGWGEGGWMFENDEFRNHYSEYQFYFLGLTLVGNIYENEDLLQKIY